MTPVRASVVVAVEQSAANLQAIIEALALRDSPDVEFIFCHGESSDPAPLNAPLPGLVRVLRSAPGSRIPLMWRDGILAASTEIVALLTAHCIPSREWIREVRRLDLPPDVAALGGYISLSRGANGRDWAIHLLRYATYSRPRNEPSVDNVAADNAVYRRSAIMACPELLPEGFWEPAYHAQFRRRGFRLALTSLLEVSHCNQYSARDFAAQRREHGYQFGSERARRVGTLRRIFLSITAPLIPALLMAKVLTRSAQYRWLGRVPLSTYLWLAFFVLNWSIGEARGLWRPGLAHR